MAPTAWIINIGTELTIGRIVNSNGAWLARELTLRGVRVRRIVCVPDDEREVVDVVRQALGSSDIVITTGGLGPTPDDRTAEFIAKALGVELVLHPEALRMVEEKYRAAGLELTEDRVKMAKLPRGARPIPNEVGTAPGIHVEVGGKHLFALPGVPREMEAMFRSYVLRVLEPLLPRLCVVEDGLPVVGVPESTLAPLLKEVQRLCTDCYIKSHPMGEELGRPYIEVKVMASAPTCDEARAKVGRVLEYLKSRVRPG